MTKFWPDKPPVGFVTPMRYIRDRKISIDVYKYFIYRD